jgi:hypothetical protein
LAREDAIRLDRGVKAVRAMVLLGVLAAFLISVAGANAGVRRASESPSASSLPTSAAAAGWHDGLLKYGGSSDCITGPTTAGESGYVGWYGDIGVSPSVGDVYYVRTGWAQLVSPCTGGSYVHFELGLPAGTDLAISSSYPVQCWYQSPSASTFTRFTSDCPQTPSLGMYGGATFDPPSGGWPTAFGSQVQIWVPLKSNQPLNGIDSAPPAVCPACVYGGLWFIDGVYSPWVFPHQGVYVVGSASSPVVSYPVPSVCAHGLQPTDACTAIGAAGTSAQVRSYIFTNGAGNGTVWSEIGTAKGGPYPTNGGVFAVSEGGWLLTEEFPDPPNNSLSLVPGGTYYWRACYQPSVGAKVCGIEQTFTTPNPGNVTPPDTSIVSHPPASTTDTSATFKLSTPKLGSTFQCSLDSAAFTPCTDPSYSGLAVGAHVFQARAKDGAGRLDPTPAAWNWTITGAVGPPPPPPPPPSPPPTLKCHVPKVIGKTLAKAKLAIAKAHCAVGKVTKKRSKVKKGLVISQTPKAGKTRVAKTRVNLVLSRGKK